MARAIIIAMTTLLVASCGRQRIQENSVYYWSTVYESDSAQQDFLSANDVRKIYLRYFDVVVDEHHQVMPNASIQFNSAIPDSMEIVPTVYIVNNCWGHQSEPLDSLILQRVVQMNETHDVKNVKEIQIDCDWTKSTREHYFKMLSNLRKRAQAQGLRLSCTIRLHQLNEAAPPVDRGILMMYNTGNVKDKRRNPIFDLHDAQPYLKYLDDYPLPLSTAYPVFAWDLLYRGDRLIGVQHYAGEYFTIATDTLIHREVALDSILQIRDIVTGHNKRANDEIILFDISKTNIERINHYHYEKILHH